MKLARTIVATFLACSAIGAFASLDGPALKITASNSFGTGNWEIGFDQFRYNSTNDSYSWFMAAPASIKNSNGVEIATIGGANAYYQMDPVVALGFFVSAGASSTHFTITSALLSFSTINTPLGQASAGTTVTDVDGDGASLTSTTKLYNAYYNGFLANNFTGLVGNSSAVSNQTAVANESFGFAPIGVPVSDMSAKWEFDLSANDIASGTSRYEVVPEPATLAVFGLAALALKKRRR